MYSRFWVNSDYINELTVLLAWFSVLIPWNIQHVTLEGLGKVIYIRFIFVQVRYRFGFEFNDNEVLFIKSPLGAYNYQAEASAAMMDPYLYWIAGAAIVAAAFALSLALYFTEASVEHHLPVEPARVMGGLLTLGTIALLVATVKLITLPNFSGLNIPLGVIFMAFFSWLLLTNPVVDNPDPN